MAIDRLDSRQLKQIASFASSGTFTTPAGVTQLYVTLVGATGTRNQAFQLGGAGPIIGGYVTTAPGLTHIVTVGAKGSDGFSTRYQGSSNGNQSGSTAFDAALIAAGGSNGGQTTGATFFDTSTPPGNPSGVPARVSGQTTSNSTNYNNYNSGNGAVWVWG